MSSNSSLSCDGVLQSRDAILNDVKAIVAKFANLGSDQIHEDHTLLGDLGMDSLDIVECTMEIEEHFDISVPDEIAERIKTVGDAADGVLALLAGRRDGG
jgi:acyl carrier protein